MSSFFSNLVQWFQSSPVLEAAKQEAIKDLTQAAEQFIASVTSHAPDMLEHVETKVADSLAVAVAGAISRSK